MKRRIIEKKEVTKNNAKDTLDFYPTLNGQ
jgi:hypothetical protein